MSVKLAHEVNAFSSGQKACETFHEPADNPSFDSLAVAYFALADERLSSTQKTFLRMSAAMLRFHELTLTALADQLSRSSSVPYSTVKWNLRLLVRIGLLDGGDNNSRGKQACLTQTAKMLVRYLEQR